VFGIATSVVQIVAAWVSAQKAIPDEVHRLSTLAQTVQSVHSKVSK
jgi:hypothetical protein